MKKVFCIVLLLLCARSVDAATISIGSFGVHTVGETFTLPIYVSTEGQEVMNAVSGTLSFPKDLLKVTSISKGGSIISLWPEEPRYSNSTGTFSFQGVVLNPGYSGSRGVVLLVSFRALAVGDASLSFSNGSILANDGSGTDIYSGSRGTTGSVTPAPAVSTPPPHVSLPSAAPKQPEVTETRADIHTPTILSYPQTLTEGTSLRVTGIAYPHSLITAHIHTDARAINLQTYTSSDGTFALIPDVMFSPGVYSLSLVSSLDGVESSSTDAMMIQVVPSFFRQVMSFIESYIPGGIAILLSLFVCVVASLYVWYRITHVAYTLKSRYRATDSTIHALFKGLRKDILTHIEKLKKAGTKRELSKEEITFISTFEKHLTEAENRIHNELRGER